jgi:predicted nucleic acid-binding protein
MIWSWNFKMYKNIIIDSCPIIFLSKINTLDILPELFPGEIRTIKKVKDELNRGFVPADELIVMNNFLKKIEVVNTNESLISSSTLSRTDKELITHAINNKYDLLVTDDNLLRRISQHENIKTIGTLGLLIQYAKKGIRSIEAVHGYIDVLIKKHKLRISVELYSEIIKTLNEI